MGEGKGTSYVLGLDLGSNSVGWAMIAGERPERGGSFEARGILGAGPRVFEAAVDGTLDDIEQGREKSLNLPRRQARGQRRGNERTGRRLHQLYRRLSRAGLLPALPSSQKDPGFGEWRKKKSAKAQREEMDAVAAERDGALKRLDREIWGRVAAGLDGAEPGERARLANVVPYLLRARALKGPLPPHEIGRALYHLGQRRGFLSNRKAAPKDEDDGTVKKGIGELEAAMAASGAETLGQYFSGLDPEQHRIRRRYTSRAMYEREFEAIWAAQQPHHAGLLTDTLRREIHRAIFFQRPLKSQAHLIGLCEHEPDRKRAPRALLEFQRFRVLQMVNHTKVGYADGRSEGLAPEQRTLLAGELETVERLTFTAAKKLLELPGNCVFGFEGGGEKAFAGNRTAVRLRGVFGAGWDGLEPMEQAAVVEDLLTIEKTEVLARRAMRVWGLDEAKAKKLADVRLEDGFAGLSRQALEKLLPLMERGKAYITAVMEVYGSPEGAEAYELLPPVKKAMPQITNPAVLRTLSEMRKVVNALIRRHGKPALIRVELARDLRNPPGLRQKMWKKGRELESQREAARRVIAETTGNREPSGTEVEKVLLAEECGWVCPYTGRSFSRAELLGEHPVVDIEHIIPRSRSLDNAFVNKTLCMVEENRNRKGTRTPWEAYAQTEQWAEILERVSKFKPLGGGDSARRKLEQFMMDPEQVRERYSDFTARQLTDTRYASRLALKYLGLLYGGTVDPEGRVRVQVTRGAATADMRTALRLNRILSDGGRKERTDHRHHAVDAVAIALTTPALLKQMSDAAQESERIGRRPVPWVPYPWETFANDVKETIENAVTSHRVRRRVRGALHKETIYSPPRAHGGKTVVHVRKGVGAMSPGELAAIVDDRVRAAVQAKVAEVGGDAKKLDMESGPPLLRHGPAKTTPVRKARYRKTETTFRVGSGTRARHVVTDTNHHMEVLETIGGKNAGKWVGVVVTTLEAHRRKTGREPLVRREHGPDLRFLFSLTRGDTIELDDEHNPGERALFHVKSLWPEQGTGRMRIAGINDARKEKDMKQPDRSGKRGVTQPMIDPLRKRGLKKVVVLPTGQLRPAHD